jgi:hypothetical protein
MAQAYAELESKMAYERRLAEQHERTKHSLAHADPRTVTILGGGPYGGSAGGPFLFPSG